MNLSLLNYCRSPDSAAVVTFKHHTKPVSSVEWHPSDSTVFASAGEDNQVIITN